jgi:hypothetical protein
MQVTALTSANACRLVPFRTTESRQVVTQSLCEIAPIRTARTSGSTGVSGQSTRLQGAGTTSRTEPLPSPHPCKGTHLRMIGIAPASDSAYLLASTAANAPPT